MPRPLKDRLYLSSINSCKRAADMPSIALPRIFIKVYSFYAAAWSMCSVFSSGYDLKSAKHIAGHHRLLDAEYLPRTCNGPERTLAQAWLPTAGEPKVTQRTSAAGHFNDAHTAAIDARPAPKLCPVVITLLGSRPPERAARTSLRIITYSEAQKLRIDAPAHSSKRGAATTYAYASELPNK